MPNRMRLVKINARKITHIKSKPNLTTDRFYVIFGQPLADGIRKMTLSV